MKEKILIVDDESDILETFKRILRKQFNVDTAIGAQEGLKLVSSNGPYAVIVSDLRMPIIDGVQFLSKAKSMAPDTVRIILTGNADLQTAIDAVNKGNVFRFLTKPCEPALFITVLKSAIGQYNLVLAERDLLEKTLSRSVKTLVDILSMVNPVAFGRSRRLQRYTRHIANQLKLSNIWQYELAALLSQLGCILIPSDIITKFYAGQTLTHHEKKLIESHPKAGSDLLINIPRLEPIARMIEKQNQPFKYFIPQTELGELDNIRLGAQILKVAIEFDKMISQGVSVQEAVEKLVMPPEECNPNIAKILLNIKIVSLKQIVKVVKIEELKINMMIDENVCTKKGALLVSKGQEITSPLLKQLRYYQRNGFIEDKIHVIV